jgi:MoaA/NifB/PqqE/SkfB family radical SAM enzyme
MDPEVSKYPGHADYGGSTGGRRVSQLKVPGGENGHVGTRSSRVALRPHDWMSSTQRSSVQGDSASERAHDLFIKRTAFGALDDDYLSELTEAEEQALFEDGPSAETLYELAFSLTQHRPTVASLARALAALTTAEELVDTRLQTKMARLRQVIERSLQNALLPASQFDRVNWAVNNECPETCPGCYQNFSPNQLSLDAACRILDWLKQARVRKLILSGGDPLLWDVWPEFLDYCMRLGFSVGVDTTGYTLDEDAATTLRQAKVSYVGIPLDAPDNERQGSLRFSRTSDLVDRELHALEVLHRFEIPSKVNTVVSKKNIVWIPDVAGRLRADSHRPNFWSLFQWSPLRANDILRTEMELDTQQFEVMTDLAEVLMKGASVHLRKQTLRSRDMSHLFINNDGRVTTFGVEPGEEFLLGMAGTDSFEELATSPILQRLSGKHSPVDRFN